MPAPACNVWSAFRRPLRDAVVESEASINGEVGCRCRNTAASSAVGGAKLWPYAWGGGDVGEAPEAGVSVDGDLECDRTNLSYLSRI